MNPAPPNIWLQPNFISANRTTESLAYPADSSLLENHEFRPLPDAGAMSFAYTALALAEFSSIDRGVGAGSFGTIQGQTYLPMPSNWQSGYGLSAGTFSVMPLIANNQTAMGV